MRGRPAADNDPTSDQPLTLATLPDVCSADEAAEALNVHVKTVRAALRRGELRGVRFGGVWRIRAVDVRGLFGQERPSETMPLPSRSPRLGSIGHVMRRRLGRRD